MQGRSLHYFREECSPCLLWLCYGDIWYSVEQGIRGKIITILMVRVLVYWVKSFCIIITAGKVFFHRDQYVCEKCSDASTAKALRRIDCSQELHALLTGALRLAWSDKDVFSVYFHSVGLFRKVYRTLWLKRTVKERRRQGKNFLLPTGLTYFDKHQPCSFSSRLASKPDWTSCLSDENKAYWTLGLLRGRKHIRT